MGNDDDLIRRLRTAADSAADDEIAELLRQAANALFESNEAMQSLIEGVQRDRRIRGKE